MMISADEGAWSGYQRNGPRDLLLCHAHLVPATHGLLAKLKMSWLAEHVWSLGHNTAEPEPQRSQVQASMHQLGP